MKKLAPRVLIPLVALLAACGPVIPLEIAMRQAVIDVFYGSPFKPPAATPVPLPIYQPPPQVSFSYPPALSALPPSAPPCAALGNLAVPKEPATPYISGPPPQGTYAMRSKGAYALGSGLGVLPSELTLMRPDKAVPGSDQVDGPYTDYTLVTGYSRTAYTEFDFRLAPDNPATPGILLTGLKWRDSVRGDLDFAPQQPMQFLQTPVSISNSWDSVGWDPIDQTSVEIQASIPQKDTVNACGTPLDTYQLAISGSIVSPTFQLTWTADYDIGTQFGGLILAEQVKLSGPDRVQHNGDLYQYQETSIIDSKPPLVG